MNFVSFYLPSSFLSLSSWVSCNLLHPLYPFAFFDLCLTMPIHYEHGSYQDLLHFPKFKTCREVFLCTGWGLFRHLLDGHDDEISLLFAKGFDAKTERFSLSSFP